MVITVGLLHQTKRCLLNTTRRDRSLGPRFKYFQRIGGGYWKSALVSWNPFVAIAILFEHILLTTHSRQR